MSAKTLTTWARALTLAAAISPIAAGVDVWLEWRLSRYVDGVALLFCSLSVALLAVAALCGGRWLRRRAGATRMVVIECPEPPVSSRWERRGLRHDDSGVTMVELLVAIGLIGIVGTVGIGILEASSRAQHIVEDETAVENAQLDATDALYLDVSDAVRVVQADGGQMTVDIARPEIKADGSQGDMACVEKTWRVDDPQPITADYDATQTWTGANLVTETRQFASPSCNGDLGDPVTHVVIGNHALVNLTPFTYFSKAAPDTPMRTPVSPTQADDSNDIQHIAAMNVDVTSRSVRMHTTRPMISGAAFGKMSAPGSGVQVAQPKAPILRVVTSSTSPAGDEGVSAPILQWTDSTANVAAGWAVFALRYPTDQVTDIGQYRQVGYVINDDPTALSKTVTWTDHDLSAGYTGQYVVTAVSAQQKGGPSSNMVITGLRPTAPSLTVAGKPTEIDLSWTAATGATSYDVYRDGSLLANIGPATTYVDPVAAGAVHAYQVVPVNRWEENWWCGADACRATVGTNDPAAKGNTGSQRALSAAKAAWTAPLAPTGLGASNRLPADQSNPASSWDPTVPLTWTAPSWTYPTWADHASNDSGVSDAAFNAEKSAVAAAKSALRYRVVRDGTTLTTTLAASSWADTSAPRGATDGWIVSASTLAGANDQVFDHNADASVPRADVTTQLLTWPSAPSCSAAKGTDSWSSANTNSSTRSVYVSVGRPGGQQIDSTRIRMANDGSVQGGDSAGWTALADGTGYTFQAQAQNAAGSGPWSGGCGATTDVVPTPAAPSFATPTCSGSAGGLAPTTLSWSNSAGSSWVSRPSSAPTAGTYWAQVTRSATVTNSDGVNTASSSTTHNGSCSVSVSAPISGGSGGLGGARDAACAPYADDGTVRQELFNSAQATLAAMYGATYHLDGGLPSASQYRETNSTSTTVTCSFYVDYAMFDSLGNLVGDWGGSAGEMFNLSGGGIVYN